MTGWSVPDDQSPHGQTRFGSPLLILEEFEDLLFDLLLVRRLEEARAMRRSGKDEQIFLALCLFVEVTGSDAISATTIFLSRYEQRRCFYLSDGVFCVEPPEGDGIRDAHHTGHRLP